MDLDLLSGLTMKQLKEIAKNWNLNPTGDKRCKQTWVDAMMGAIDAHRQCGNGSSATAKGKAAATRKLNAKAEQAPASTTAAALKTIEELAPKNDNYIPIYKYREKMQGLTRAEQDAELYKLVRQDKISLSSLQESRAYTPAQIKQAIPSPVEGPPIFFIVLE